MTIILTREVTWITPYITRKGRKAYDPGTPGTIVVGILAGALVWGLNHSNDNLQAALTQIYPIISVFVAGAGGGRVLEGYVERSLQESAISETASALERATRALERQQQGQQGRKQGRRGDNRRRRVGTPTDRTGVIPGPQNPPNRADIIE